MKIKYDKKNKPYVEVTRLVYGKAVLVKFYGRAGKLEKQYVK